MWSRPNILSDFVMLVAAAGSSAFLIIPYAVNLIIAARIKNYLHRNQIAKGWFNNHAPVFTMFVVLTGGCFPALAVVSSGIFGLVVFSSGLTKYELKQMIRIKLIASIILENVPQLLFQAVYSFRLGTVTDNTALAFTASVLSITSTVLSYCMARTHSSVTFS